MKKTRSTYSLSNAALSALEVRGDNRSAAVEKIVERYLLILGDTLHELRGQFSRAELEVIAAVLRDTLMVGQQACRTIPFIVGDAVRTSKWPGVDGDLLVSKLEAMRANELVALADAVERYWAAVPDGSKISEILN